MFSIRNSGIFRRRPRGAISPGSTFLGGSEFNWKVLFLNFFGSKILYTPRCSDRRSMNES